MAKEFEKLLNFLKNPIKFFEENEENTDSLLDFMVFISREYVVMAGTSKFGQLFLN